MRFVTAITSALIALSLGTGIAQAASEDRTEVMIGAIIVAAGFFAFLFVVYVAKLYLGLERSLPPPEEHDAHGGHH
jgi:hypothetical protein